MGIQKLTERQVVGTFYKKLNMDTGASWINDISNLFTSDQASEEYAWLGMAPAMREWVGGRNAKGFRENSLTIANKHFEGTLEILLKDINRDKTDQILTRVRELADKTNSHWASLLSTAIVNGASSTCYDGHYFFDTTHEEGDSGSQSNSITSTLSALPASNPGTTALPSVEEAQFSITKAIETIAGFVDDQGEPMNENAQSFMVMVPVSYMNVYMQAVATPTQVAASQSALEALKQKFSIDVVPNVRLSTMASSYQIVVFRTDAELKSLIRQEEIGVQTKMKGPGSEYEFDNDAWQFGVDTWRNVGYGYWQNSCLVTLA